MIKQKNKIALIAIIMLSLIGFSQEKVEVENGLFVNFLGKPKYSTNTKTSNYLYKNENCVFVALIQRNFIPHYPEYLKSRKKWNSTEILKVENTFLDNAVRGKLGYTGNNGNFVKIKVGSFNGRKIEYSAINPLTGKRGKRFSIILLVRDRLINFDTWILNDSKISLEQKDSFFNSITTK